MNDELGAYRALLRQKCRLHWQSTNIYLCQQHLHDLAVKACLKVDGSVPTTDAAGAQLSVGHRTHQRV